MKTAVFIMNGLTQLVLTPESDYEKNVLAIVHGGGDKVKYYFDNFYECMGGWVRVSNDDKTSQKGEIKCK